MGTKYYAVVSGRVPGIYNDWATAEKMVKGFPGAIFKSFHSRADAETFMKKSTLSTEDKDVGPHNLPLLDKTIIYTDGSFSDGECGFGIVIITSNGDKIAAYGRVSDAVHNGTPTNNVGELYAIYVALSLVRGDIILYTDSQYSISCLTTYIHDWMQKGWAGVANRQIIEGVYAQMQNRNVIFRYVVGHSGIEFNEEADKLANQGRMGTDELIILKNGVNMATN
jgi:ribonuclease HI